MCIKGVIKLSKGELRHRSGYDRHHIFYQKRHYKSGYLLALRNYWYCKISIPKDTIHKLIHEYIGDIPTPKPTSAKRVLSRLQEMRLSGEISNTDEPKKRLYILASMFELTDPPTAYTLNQQLKIMHTKKPP